MWSFTGFLVIALFINYVQGNSGNSTTTVSPDMASYIEECTKESKVNRVYITKMQAGYWSLPKITTSLKYWAFCYLKKINVMTEAGVLRQDVVLKHFRIKEKQEVVKIIDKCLFNNAHLPMDTAWHYLECFHKTNFKLCKRIHGI